MRYLSSLLVLVLCRALSSSIAEGFNNCTVLPTTLADEAIDLLDVKGLIPVKRLGKIDFKEDSWYKPLEPVIATGLDFNQQSSSLIDELTSRPALGEVWESDTERIYRYGDFDRTLNSHLKIRPGAGWRNVSTDYQLFPNLLGRCENVVARYAMLTPNVSSTLLGMFQNLSGISNPSITMYAGCNGTATAMHYDRKQNFFLQLAGKKRFVLFPPDSLKDLYYAPAGHPFHRQSLLEPTNLSTVNTRQFPNVLSLKGKGLVADLEKGDVLAIPLFWSHYVVSLSDDSLGLAIRWALDRKVDDALAKEPLPFENGWPLKIRVPLVRSYINSLLDPGATLAILLAARWKTAFPSWEQAITSQHFEEGDVTGEPYVSYIEKGRSYAKRINHLIKKLESNPNARDMFLLDYCDDVILTMFTAKEGIWFMLSEFAKELRAESA